MASSIFSYLVKEKKETRILILFGYLLCFLGISSTIFLWSLSFEDFIDLTVSWTNSETKRGKIEALIFPKFQFLRWVGMLPIALGIMIITQRKLILDVLIILLKAFKKLFFISSGLSYQGRVILFLILAISVSSKAFLVWELPIYYDEGWTYIHFTQKGFLTSWTYYPYPNNHVLHSIFTTISAHLPFPDIVNLRLPSFLFGLLSQLAFFKLIHYVAKERTLPIKFGMLHD